MSDDIAEPTLDEEAPRTYWRLYLGAQAEMEASTLAAMQRDPILGPMIAGMPPAAMEAQRAAGLRRFQKGIAGDWSEYDQNVRDQAAMFAELGMPFGSWYAIVLAMNQVMVPVLVKSLSERPDHLAQVLIFGQSFLDRALGIMTETYLAAKQRHVEAQRALAEARARELDASERRLRQHAAMLEAVLGAMRDGLVLRAPDGEDLVVNSEAVRLLGSGRVVGNIDRSRWEAFEVDGRTRIPSDQLPMVRAMAGESVHEMEMILRDATAGETRRLLADGRPVDLDGVLIGALVTFRDVTDRTRVQDLQRRSEELEKQNLLFQEASRLKSEFLANMSHELRTPLNAILGFSELIYDGLAGETTQVQREYLDDVLKSGRHLLRLINDVLDLAKVEAGRIDLHSEDVDLPGLAREVAAVLRSTSGKRHVVIDVEARPGVDLVHLDPGRVKQVLFNYLSNALKVTPEHGRVLLRLSPEEPSAVRIEVIDSGVGIAEKDIARLFREFEQLDGGAAKQHAGTGLGLALTRRIVEAMGGNVGVESELGRGSTFYAVLPTRVERSRSFAGSLTVPGASGDAPRILVVEDDPDDQAVIVRTLTDQGYAVVTAATGAQALLRCREGRFDAITLDIALPDSSGFDVLRAVRSEPVNRATPVVVISVAAERKLVAGFSLAGALTKPLVASDLSAALAGCGVTPSLGRVLIIDDDPASLRLAEASIEELGYRAICFREPLDALDWLAHERPSAIVLDLLMPRFDGFEFIERLRARRSEARIPVFVWTVKDLSIAERMLLQQDARTVLLEGKKQGRSLLKELEALLPARSAGVRHA